MQINGIILINKERNISSNKIVNKVKYLLNADKAGHLGTLDVLGEGLLPVTLGKATKLFDYFLNKDKVYRTTFRFGITTETLDLEGPITQQNDKIVKFNEIFDIIPQFIGKINQLPPIFSAKKINGQTAYSLARQGKSVSLKPKEIEIYSIKCLKEIEKNTFEFEIHCSSGTYIRSICRDMALKLNTYGVMLNIIRTKCGNFSLSNAFTLNQIQNKNYQILSLDSIFTNLKKIMLSNLESRQLLNGMTLKCNKENGLYRCYDNENNFLGLVKISDNLIKFEIRLI